MKADDEDSKAPEIEIERHLYEMLKAKAEELGYSSADDLIVRVLEEAFGDDGSDLADNSQEAEEAVRERLKSLGYLS
jgi:hypothetical protein